MGEPTPGSLPSRSRTAPRGIPCRARRRMRFASPSRERRRSQPRAEHFIDRWTSLIGDSPSGAWWLPGVAARLGIPPGVVTQLRGAGELVQVGEGIDYPRDVLNGLLSRMAEIATGGPLTITRVRDVLRTSRRHAEALLAYRRAQRRKRDRLGVR